MSSNDYYKAVQEGITRASLIRKDLDKHETEYYPEKVRLLNKTYISTVKEIIRQGELYIKSLGLWTNPEQALKRLEVEQVVENYRAFLSTLEK